MFTHSSLHTFSCDQLQQAHRTEERNNRRTSRDHQSLRTTLERALDRRRRSRCSTASHTRGLASLRCLRRLGRRYTRNRRYARAGRGTQGLRSKAELLDLVLNGRLVGRVRAVVVADEDVGVDVTQADVVVAFGVAGVDAGGVAGDTGIEDAGVGLA